MPGISLAAVLVLASGPGTDLTPIDSAANSVTAYWLSFGAVSVVGLVLFLVFLWPGWLRKQMTEAARADLLTRITEQAAEITGLRQDLKDSRAETKELQDFVRGQFVPGITSFTDVAKTLIPILQAQIQSRGANGGGK